MSTPKSVVEQRAMVVARIYEEHVRRATVFDVSSGAAFETIREAFEVNRLVAPHPPLSADLVSRAPTGDRIIEVKGRAEGGPRDVSERQLETLTAAGDIGWLYAVRYMTRPRPVELLIVQNPGRLPWRLERAARKPKGAARSAGDEAIYRVEEQEIGAFGELVNLTGLPLPKWAGEAAEWVPRQRL